MLLSDELAIHYGGGFAARQPCQRVRRKTLTTTLWPPLSALPSGGLWGGNAPPCSLSQLNLIERAEGARAARSLSAAQLARKVLGECAGKLCARPARCWRAAGRVRGETLRTAGALLARCGAGRARCRLRGLAPNFRTIPLQCREKDGFLVDSVFWRALTRLQCVV